MPHVVRNEIAREIAFPVERVWPILAKTDWINRSLGLPSVQYEMSPESNGGILVKARASYFGLPLRWKEWPFEWVENDYYSVRRSFDHGPIDDARFSVQLTSHSATTVSVTARSEIRPRNWAALLLVRYGLGPLVTRRMGKLLQPVEQFIAGQPPVPLPNLSREPVAEPALQVALDRLRKSRQPPELILQLEKLVKESPDAAVARLRPLAIAKQWGKPGWDIVRLFFEATRAGLLDLSWEVLCPNCRSTPALILPDTSSLSSLYVTPNQVLPPPKM